MILSVYYGNVSGQEIAEKIFAEKAQKCGVGQTRGSRQGVAG